VAAGRVPAMAPKKKLGQILVKLVSMAQTGTFYVTKKNPRNVPYKLQRVKYDPVVNQHVLFTEAKLK
jgi:large subunit ribosomal protein L33